MKNSAFIVALLMIIISFSTSCGVSYKKKRYVKKNYKEIKKSFPEASISLIQDSIKVIFPNNVVFDIGSASLKGSFKNRFLRFSEILKHFNKSNILITGYTDNSGSEESNLKLSLDRAKNVESALLIQKIEAKRLFTWGLSEKNPISSNSTTEGKARNRRVEFVVLYNTDAK